MQGVDVIVGDGVVPHTPVLSERKQLMTQRVQTIPSTPADQPPYIVPHQLAESSLAAVTTQASGGTCTCYMCMYMHACYTV